MKYYTITKFYDNGAVETDVFTQSELEAKSWVVHPSARRRDTTTVHVSRLPDCTLYIDEFDSEEEARKFADSVTKP